jgi:hypothetical protein
LVGYSHDRSQMPFLCGERIGSQCWALAPRLDCGFPAWQSRTINR